MDSEELKDLEGAWKTAESIRSGRALVIDMRRFASVDEPTRLLLDRLQAAGATFLDRPPNVAIGVEFSLPILFGGSGNPLFAPQVNHLKRRIQSECLAIEIDSCLSSRAWGAPSGRSQGPASAVVV